MDVVDYGCCKGIVDDGISAEAYGNQEDDVGVDGDIVGAGDAGRCVVPGVGRTGMVVWGSGWAAELDESGGVFVGSAQGFGRAGILGLVPGVCEVELVKVDDDREGACKLVAEDYCGLMLVMEWVDEALGKVFNVECDACAFHCK